MNVKKAARRRGQHVTFFKDGVSGQLVDWKPEGAQLGMPFHLQFNEWKKKYQDVLYLIEDTAWRKPPVLTPSKESLAKIKAGLTKERKEKSSGASEKREEALRGVVRRVARWEGSGKAEDLAEAKQWATSMVELWPDLAEQVLEEFRRVSGAGGDSGREEKKAD